MGGLIIRVLNYRVLIILFAFSSLLLSCERTIDPFIGDHEKKLVLNAEIEPDKPIYIFVSTSVGFGEADEPFQPDDLEQFQANIQVGGQEESEELLFFEKEESDGGGLSWRTRRAFATAELQELSIEATLAYDDYELSASANTTIPRALMIDTVKYIGNEQLMGQDAYFYRVEVQIMEEELSLYQDFHLLVSDSSSFLEISHFGENQDAIEKPHHHHGVFIHGEYLTSNTLNFLVESNKELETLDIELRNCSPSYLDYHVSLSRSFSSQNSPFNEPTAYYTNIENGLGVFSSFARFNYKLQF